MEFDTAMGGDRRDFPATTWSVIAAACDRERLAELCRRFWKPVYHYIRAGWKKSNEDAKDLTQAFFLWLLEGDALARYRPDRGGFRAYLKVVLRHFLANHEEAISRLKRGGGVEVFAIRGDEPGPDTDDPEKALDRAWLAALLETALGRVRERFRGRETMFGAFEEYELKGEKRSYAEVAEALGIKESDVRNHLFAVREELRREVLAEISHTVDGDPSVEYRVLFGS